MLTIGRSQSCDVVVDVPGVDDEHAKISEVALVAIGRDCAIGDVPIDAGARRLIMPGDEIQIGSVVLAIGGREPSAGDGERSPHPRIRVVEGHNFGDELTLEAEGREYVIGRSPKADLVLEDREVSREHVKLVRQGFRIFVHDGASTRGSWLGRAAVYQGMTIEWERPRMLKLGASVLSLGLPAEAGAQVPDAQASAPMTPPPRKRPPPLPAKPAEPEAAPANVVAYHYEAKPPSEPELARGHEPTPPPPASLREGFGSRTAWKKTGPTVGRAAGLLLLALAGVAILGVLFGVFSLME